MFGEDGASAFGEGGWGLVIVRIEWSLLEGGEWSVRVESEV